MTKLEAAEAAGVTLRKLQWWEHTGLISRSRGSESVRQARIWEMISRRFGCLRKSVTHSIEVLRCVRIASRSPHRFIALYAMGDGWRSSATVGAKCLRDESAVMKFGAYIPGSVVVIEMPQKENA